MLTQPQAPIDRRSVLLAHRFMTASQVCALGAALLAVAVFLGYLFKTPVILEIGAAPPPLMAPNTAATVVLLSLATVLRSMHSLRSWRHSIASAAAAAATLIGLITLLEYFLLTDFGMTFLFREILANFDNPSIVLEEFNRPSPRSSVSASLLGMALLGIESRFFTKFLLTQAFAFLTLAISVVALFGHYFDVTGLFALRELHPAIGMSLQTALAFLLLSLSIVFLKPNLGAMKLLVSAGSGGVLARRLIFALFVLPTTIGLIFLPTDRTGLDEFIMRFSVFSVIMLSVFLALSWFVSKQVETTTNELLVEKSYTELLGKVASATNEKDSPISAVEVALNQIRSLSGWALGHAFIFDRAKRTLQPMKIWSVDDPDAYPQFISRSNTSIFSEGNGIPWEATRAKKAIWISELSKNPHFLRPTEARQEGLVAGFFFPIFVKQDVAAVLEFFSHASSAPDEKLLRVVSQVAILLGRSFERHWSEEEIRRSSARLQDTLARITDGFFAMDSELRFTYLNTTAQRYFGRATESIVGSKLFDQFPMAKNTQFEKEYQRAISTGSPRHFTARSPLTQRWVSLHIYPSEEGLSVFFQDIHEKVRAEEALKQSEERFRLLVGSVRDYAIFILDSEGRVATWNAGATRVTGFSEIEIIGKHFSVFYTNEDQQLGLPKKELASTRSSSQIERSGWRISKTGDRFWAEVLISPVMRENGELQGYSVVMKDATERKRFQDALTEKTRQLKRSNEDLENFAYTASHDLREPLHMITSYLGLLEKRLHGKLDEKGHKFLNYAVDGARRLDELILGLLNFSRAGRVELTLERLSMDELTDQVLLSLKNSIELNHAEIIKEPLPSIRAQPQLLSQLLQNLLSNAVKFHKPGIPPKVVISAKRGEREWIFAISDNGIGIARENVDQLFQIFRRLHTRTEFPGTGIGLAVTHRIVERHGGKIWVESEPGRGSTFFFTIPDHVAALSEPLPLQPTGS